HGTHARRAEAALGGWLPVRAPRRRPLRRRLRLGRGSARGQNGRARAGDAAKCGVLTTIGIRMSDDTTQDVAPAEPEPTAEQVATLAAAGVEFQRIPDSHFPPCRIRGCDEPGKHSRTGYCVEHRRRHLLAIKAGTVTE